MKSMNKYIALSYLLLGSLTAPQNLFGMDNNAIDASSRTSHSESSFDKYIYRDIDQLISEVTLQPTRSKEQYQIFLDELFECNKRYHAVEAALRKTPKGTERADTLQRQLEIISEELYYQSTPFFPADFVYPVLPYGSQQKIRKLGFEMDKLLTKANLVNRSNVASQDFDNWKDQIKYCSTLHAEIKNILETYPEGCKFSRGVRKTLAWIEEYIDDSITFVARN